MEDILAVMMDAQHVRIIPPQEKDSDDVKVLKLFMLACLARRNMDPDFNTDMADWFASITEEDFIASRGGGHFHKQ
jgi:hypothetical protein